MLPGSVNAGDNSVMLFRLGKFRAILGLSTTVGFWLSAYRSPEAMPTYKGKMPVTKLTPKRMTEYTAANVG